MTSNPRVSTERLSLLIKIASSFDRDPWPDVLLTLQELSNRRAFETQPAASKTVCTCGSLDQEHLSWCALSSNGRCSPRPIDKRVEDGSCFCRCKFCDWELINGEGITRTRPCCVEGLKFDLAHGLTPDGTGKWQSTASSANETTPQVRCTHFSGKHTLETRCTWCNWPSDVATNGPPDETTDAEVDTFVDGLMAILCLGDSLKAPNTCREVTREAVRNFLARRPEEPRETKALPRLEYNRHCGECQRNKITIEVFAKAISKEPAPTRCAECQTPRLCRVERECLRNRYVRPAVEPADRTGGDPECFGSAGAPRSEDEYRARVNALALECARASAVVRSPEKAPEPLCDCGAEQRRQRGYHAQCYSFCASKKTNNPQQLPAKATDEPCKCVQYCAIYNKGTPGCRGLPLHPTDYYSSQNGKG